MNEYSFTLEDAPAMARFIDEIQSAPRKLADRGNALRLRARRRVHAMRLDGESRLFRFQVGTLEQIDGLLLRTPKWPGLKQVADGAEKLVQKRLAAFTAPPIANYDDLAAKDIGHRLGELAYVDLLRVRRWEETHKARKTVLAAVERELVKRESLPAQVAEAV